MISPHDQERLQRQLAQFSLSWGKQIQDVFRIQEIYGRQINAIFKALAPGINAFGKQVAEVLTSLKWFAEALVQALPPNWRGIDPGEMGSVLHVMDETGWCLVWCPRAEIIEQLLAATDVEARTQIVLGSKELIIGDLRNGLLLGDRSELEAHRHAASRAIDAFTDGHYEAAQALAANDISALIGETLGMRFGDARKTLAGDPMEESINRFRQQAVFNMVSRSLSRYYADRGDPVPTAFSRHATSHSISEDQYTEINALAALLLAVAFIIELELVLQEQSDSAQEAS